MCILLIWYGPFLAASEATTASKQPQRSNLTSDLKSVTPITYLSMCILFIWYEPSYQPLRPLQPPNSSRGQNLHQFGLVRFRLPIAYPGCRTTFKFAFMLVGPTYCTTFGKFASEQPIGACSILIPELHFAFLSSSVLGNVGKLAKLHRLKKPRAQFRLFLRVAALMQPLYRAAKLVNLFISQWNQLTKRGAARGQLRLQAACCAQQRPNGQRRIS